MISEAVLCLAMNIYFEARSEGLDGQMAVAEVTMNRVKDPRWPDNICDVVWQDKQFSWTHDGKSDKMYHTNAKNTSIWLAEAYVSGKIESFFTNGATHYHTSEVEPYWSNHFEKTTVIGDHIFYR